MFPLFRPLMDPNTRDSEDLLSIRKSKGMVQLEKSLKDELNDGVVHSHFKKYGNVHMKYGSSAMGSRAHESAPEGELSGNSELATQWAAAQVEELFGTVDVDQNGEIDQDEFDKWAIGAESYSAVVRNFFGCDTIAKPG